MSSEILVRLEDIQEQTENILSVVDGMTFEVFLSHVAWSAAVIRFFEVIGEAAKYIRRISVSAIRMLRGRNLQDFVMF